MRVTRALLAARNRLSWFIAGPVLASLAAPAVRSPRYPQPAGGPIDPGDAPSGRLAVDYEVSLTELTLTQDLRALIGSCRAAIARVAGAVCPGDGAAERQGNPGVGRWTARCAGRARLRPGRRRTSALHVSFRGRASPATGGWRSATRITFRARGPAGWPCGGEMESWSRATICRADVEQIAIRPVWQLSDAEERRTKQVEVRFRSATGPTEGHSRGSGPAPSGPESRVERVGPTSPAIELKARGLTRISELLDETTRISWPILLLIALASRGGSCDSTGPRQDAGHRRGARSRSATLSAGAAGIGDNLGPHGERTHVALALVVHGRDAGGNGPRRLDPGRRLRDRGGRPLASGAARRRLRRARARRAWHWRNE